MTEFYAARATAFLLYHDSGKADEGVFISMMSIVIVGAVTAQASYANLRHHAKHQAVHYRVHTAR
ncbi:hypothetical protein [Burkholderia vietnamiensis]|uniref:hypothetical protein n=1 Tax=Burkholderia vietnamiensis TaxID=60552 RepID=UPI000AC30234|nr:hypothetical protein [Burkholderia vietnamiensis]